MKPHHISSSSISLTRLASLFHVISAVVNFSQPFSIPPTDFFNHFFPVPSHLSSAFSPLSHLFSTVLAFPPLFNLPQFFSALPDSFHVNLLFLRGRKKDRQKERFWQVYRQVDRCRNHGNDARNPAKPPQQIH